MSDNDSVRILVQHLSRLADIEITPGFMPSGYDPVRARRILADPQAHVDALVEAGVLQHGYRSEPGGGWHYYQVVDPKPPHEHDWRVSPHQHSGPPRIVCANGDCLAWHTVSIDQWPKDRWPKYDGKVPS